MEATVGNFMSHVSAADAAASGGEGDVVPDRSPQVQDAPANDNAAPKDPQLQEPEIGDEPPEAEVEADVPDEMETLRALKAELDGGTALPESLKDRTVPVKINGHMYDVPVAELAQGYQRNSDYSKKLAEVQRFREETQQMRGGLDNFIQDLRNPQTFVSALKELDLYEPFIAAAREEGKRRLKMQDLSPEARQYAMQLERERDLRSQEARRRENAERRMQELQKQQPDQDSIRLKHQLDQLVPRALSKHKVADYPLARDLFSQNLNNLYEGGDVTAQLVDAAAQATAEQLADIALRLPKPANDNAKNGTLGVRRPAGAPGKPMQRGKGGTSTDFAAHLDRLNGSR